MRGREREGEREREDVQYLEMEVAEVSVRLVVCGRSRSDRCRPRYLAPACARHLGWWSAWGSPCWQREERARSAGRPRRIRLGHSVILRSALHVAPRGCVSAGQGVRSVCRRMKGQARTQSVAYTRAPSVGPEIKLEFGKMKHDLSIFRGVRRWPVRVVVRWVSPHRIQRHNRV